MRVGSHRSPENTDPLLRPFLQAEDEAEAQRLLAQLISEHVQPLVREIAHAKLYGAPYVSVDGGYAEEAEDACSEVVLHLLSRLRDLRNRCDQACSRLSARQTLTRDKSDSGTQQKLASTRQNEVTKSN